MQSAVKIILLLSCCPWVHIWGIAFIHLISIVHCVEEGTWGDGRCGDGIYVATVFGHLQLAFATSGETKEVSAVSKVFFGKPDPAGSHNIIGRNIGNEGELKVSKDGGDVDAITASTITSRAFLNAVNNAYKVYKGNASDVNSGATTQQ